MSEEITRLWQSGHHTQALSGCQEALRSNPWDIATLNLLAILHFELGQPELAKATLEQVCQLQPNLAAAHYNLAKVFNEGGEFEAAIQRYQRAIHLKPDFALAHNNLGVCYQKLGQSKKALAHHQQALAIDPTMADAAYNAGIDLRALNDDTAATLAYLNALAINPGHVQALTNLGFIEEDARRYGSALQYYDAAVAANPQPTKYIEAHVNAALCRLKQDQFEQGWQQYEWRWRNPLNPEAHRRQQPALWTGQEPIAGKNLYIYAEQGFGDTIQFTRYVMRLAGTAGYIHFAVQPGLLRLMQTSLSGVTNLEVIALDSDAPAHDLHCPLLNLPLAMGVYTPWFDGPYIQSDPAGRPEQPSNKLRVGITWNSKCKQLSPAAIRNMPIEAAAPLWNVPVEWVSLQFGDVPKEPDGNPLDTNAIKACRDFLDTAHLIEQLDLVISVDTSVAHLAAAMGKPTWVLLPYNADWRWFLEPDSCRWYPAARLYRQPQPGTWAQVIARVAQDLNEWAGRAGSADIVASAGAAPPSKEQVKALYAQALQLHQAGQLSKAHALYQQVLEATPTHVDALHYSGVIAYQSGDFEAAVQLITRAIGVQQKHATVHPIPHANLALALRKLKRYSEALAHLNTALSLAPDYADALNSRGNTLIDLQRPAEALPDFERAITLAPTKALAYNGRGTALLALGRHEDALLSFDQAVQHNPNFADALSNRGNALMALRQFASAIASYDRALAIQTNNAHVHYNRGTALQEMGRTDVALRSYNLALQCKPDFLEALRNRGNLLIEMKRLDEALVDYEAAYALNPEHDYLLGVLLHARMKVCNWQSLAQSLDLCRVAIEECKKVAPPFIALLLMDEPQIHRTAARSYVKHKFPSCNISVSAAAETVGQKIRIGYYSADFHNHATCCLMAGVFELHDKERYEIYGISFGQQKNDAMRERVSGAFTRFIDATAMSDKEVAEYSRNLGIDIAVDLKGYTAEARPGIFAHRCAPVQVSYLGYPGTMAAPYMDYIIADRTVIPEEAQSDYTEKIVYLPHSYQANDSGRPIASRVFTRAELGLPETGFVFCCFNNNYKIQPATFDVWMKILKQVEGSVLWLFEGNPTAAVNLQSEAEARGVDSRRLVFARPMPNEEHLARQRCADLFLDTLPCNAHTTASDALWAGVPVLTCLGKAFAGRVAGSLLLAMELPELVAPSPEQYEAKAVALANQPTALHALKVKLQRNRLTTPLFDTRSFTAHLEAGFESMIQLKRRGMPAQNIYVQP